MSRIGKRLYVMASVLACGSALAQTYPAKPVRIIVPNAPSGLVDVSARSTRWSYATGGV